MKLDWDTHDRLLEQDLETYFKTPHYEGWPGSLVRLDRLTKNEAKALVKASWEDAPKVGKRR